MCIDFACKKFRFRVSFISGRSCCSACENQSGMSGYADVDLHAEGQKHRQSANDRSVATAPFEVLPDKSFHFTGNCESSYTKRLKDENRVDKFVSSRRKHKTNKQAIHDSAGYILKTRLTHGWHPLKPLTCSNLQYFERAITANQTFDDRRLKRKKI